MTKDQVKMISKALTDCENRIYDSFERQKNEIEMLQQESIEDLKQISKLIKKLK